ncbi:TonB-dependent receptor [Paracoccus caeni]|uniref:TonB-dependent receptor n=1 Tax=Paracoccus caeni TaxID=657651 RepID=A0A934SFD0_9RHOB|nr:TonB-dependent receptor [Paracoccus caeni]MBK4215966.1 TonB-dependent receptor [Paracoccus caeni]
MKTILAKRRAVIAALMTGSAICSGLVLPQIAQAQQVIDIEPGNAQLGMVAPAEDTVVLQTITLYGDRTTTNIDDSTASVAVVDQKALESPTILTYDDAYRQMANVSKGDWTESGFIIRGVNSEGLTPGLGAPLATFYIDGVQQTVEGTRRGQRGAFDLEQLEVYRGPQSTLTGRAALAGAVYLRTKDPEFSPSGAAQVTYGSDNHKQIGLAYGDALGDRLAYRVSGEYSRKDSDLNYPSYKGYDRYDDYVKDDYWSLRAKLLWLPGEDDNTRVLFSYARSFDAPTQNDIYGPNWSSSSSGYDARRGDGWGDILPDFYLAGFPYVPLVNPGAPGLHDFAAFQDVRETRVDNFGVEVEHEINANLTLTAQTGWTHSVTSRNSINHGTPGEFYTVDGEFDQRLLSQEFRLNYEFDNLRWVGGLYFSKEEHRSYRNAMLPNLDLSSPTGLVIEDLRTKNTADIRNTALFAEVEYEFAPSWSIIGGGRLDRFSQDQHATVDITTPFRPDVPSSSTSSSNEYSDTVFIPKLGISYDLSEDQSLSLIYQEGYRPGGASIRAKNGSPYSYDAEWTKNLELSWRGRFMDDRLSVAANVFYQKWDGQQVEVWETPGDSTTSYIANAGESKSYGAELDLAYEVTDRLDVTASVGLLHTEFTDFVLGNNDYTGLAFGNAPKRNLSLGVAWGDDLGWFANGNLRVQSSMLSRLESNNPLELGGFGTVDAAVGYGWENAKLTAYATNLFDREYFTYEYGPGAMATLGDRREIGLRLDYSF